MREILSHEQRVFRAGLTRLWRGGRSSELAGGATALGYAVSEKRSYELTKLLS